MHAAQKMQEKKEDIMTRIRMFPCPSECSVLTLLDEKKWNLQIPSSWFQIVCRSFFIFLQMKQISARAASIWTPKPGQQGTIWRQTPNIKHNSSFGEQVLMNYSADLRKILQVFMPVALQAFKSRLPAVAVIVAVFCFGSEHLGQRETTAVLGCAPSRRDMLYQWEQWLDDGSWSNQSNAWNFEPIVIDGMLRHVSAFFPQPLQWRTATVTGFDSHRGVEMKSILRTSFCP